MDYQNARLVLLSKVAHTRGLIDKSGDKSDAYLLVLLDQQEAALHEYDEQQKEKQNHDSIEA